MKLNKQHIVNLLIVFVLFGIIFGIFGHAKADRHQEIMLNPAYEVSTVPQTTSGNYILKGPDGANYDYWLVKYRRTAQQLDDVSIYATLPASLSQKYYKMVPVTQSQYVISKHPGAYYQCIPYNLPPWIGGTKTFCTWHLPVYGDFTYGWWNADDDENTYLNGNFINHIGSDAGYGPECCDCRICNYGQKLYCASNTKTYCAIGDADNPPETNAGVQYTICRGYAGWYQEPITYSMENEQQIPFNYFSTSGANTLKIDLWDSQGGDIAVTEIYKMYKNVSSNSPPGVFTLNNPVVNCNTTGCTRSISLSWSASTNATVYGVYEIINGSWQQIRSTSSTSITLPNDSGNTNRTFSIVAYNSYGAQNGDRAVIATACNPYAVITNAPNCSSGSTQNSIGWRKCFADTSSLSRSECGFIPPNYTYRIRAEFSNVEPSVEDIITKFESIVGLNIDNVKIIKKSKQYDISIVKLTNSNIEQPVKEALRSFGYYKDTIGSNRTNIVSTCTIGNCSNPVVLFSNSNTDYNTNPYIDNSFNTEVPNQYTIVVRRNSDGATSQINSNLSSCKSVQKGLDIQYDPNIALDPPPGFADLFAPIFEEIIPE